MTGIRLADYILAAAGLLGHALVLLLLFRRHLSRRFLAFTVLIAFYLLRSSFLLLPGSFIAKGVTYWLFIFLDPVLQGCVMLAVAVAVWRRRIAILPGATCFLLVAGLLAWLIGPTSYYSPQTLAIKLSILVSALWLQIAAALWTSREQDPQPARLSVGIATGFAAYSVVNIVTESVRMHFVLPGRHSTYAMLSYLRVVVYLGCLATWSLLLWAVPHTFHTTVSQTERLES